MTANEVATATEEITCLSVQQPHIDDIFFSGKFSENRSWSTDFRGELFLHSSSKIDEDSVADQLTHEKYDARKSSPTGLMTGAIFGRVNLVECVPSWMLAAAASDDVIKVLGGEKSQAARIRYDYDKHGCDLADAKRIDFLKELLANTNPVCWRFFTFAKFAWIVVEAEMLDEPIPFNGKLRLWTAEIESDRLVMASLRKRKWKPSKIPTLTKT